MSNSPCLSEVSGSSVQSSRSHRLSEHQWRALIEAHGRSDLTVSSFCREHGLSVSCFYKWRHRFTEQASTSDGRFVRLDPSGPSTDHVELVLPDGVVVRAPVSYLSQMVRLVYRDTPC